MRSPDLAPPVIPPTGAPAAVGGKFALGLAIPVDLLVLGVRLELAPTCPGDPSL